MPRFLAPLRPIARPPPGGGGRRRAAARVLHRQHRPKLGLLAGWGRCRGGRPERDRRRGGSASGTGTGGSPGVPGVLQSGFARLTRAEYRATIKDAFGVDADVSGIPEDGRVGPYTSNIAFASDPVQPFLLASEDLAALIVPSRLPDLHRGHGEHLHLDQLRQAVRTSVPSPRRGDRADGLVDDARRPRAGRPDHRERDARDGDVGAAAAGCDVPHDAARGRRRARAPPGRAPQLRALGRAARRRAGRDRRGTTTAADLGARLGSRPIAWAGIRGRFRCWRASWRSGCTSTSTSSWPPTRRTRRRRSISSCSPSFRTRCRAASR